MIKHLLQMCPSASTMVIFAERRAGTKAAMIDRIAMKNTLRTITGHTRSTRSGTELDDAGGM
jgi:hypothetical protein